MDEKVNQLKSKIDILVHENDRTQQDINEQKKVIQMKEIEINELKTETGKIKKGKDVVSRKLLAVEEQKSQVEKQRYEFGKSVNLKKNFNFVHKYV